VFDDGGLAATCWVALAGEHGAIDWRAVGEIVRRVHRLGDGDIPSGYPVPSPTTFPWWDFDGMLADAGDQIDAAARAGLEAAIDAGREWTHMPPAATVICHGDVHPGNVMMTAGGPVLLDWDLMCRAPAAWDHAMLLTLLERWGGDPDAYQSFAEGYGVSMIEDRVAERLATLRNVAATLMRVRAGRTDPAARAEAERRLRYWRGDPDAPTWNAQ
jgi:Ser/Thr protein kinase RdoA (MazF antagonist)